MYGLNYQPWTTDDSQPYQATLTTAVKPQMYTGEIVLSHITDYQQKTFLLFSELSSLMIFGILLYITWSEKKKTDVENAGFIYIRKQWHRHDNTNQVANSFI